MKTSRLFLISVLALCGGCDLFPSAQGVNDQVVLLTADHPTEVRRKAVVWLSKNAARCLSDERKDKLVLVLAEVLAADEDRLVRAYSATSIGRLQRPSGVAPLVKAMKEDPDRIVRWDSVKALASLRDKSTVNDLLHVARADVDTDVRIAAVEGVASVADDRAISALITMLSDRNESVAAAAGRALEKLTGQSFGMNQRAWREWWQKQVQGEKAEEQPPAEKPKKSKKKRWLFF